jgi:hypothetical protein
MDEHEISEICRKYGFERQAFARFLEDFFIVPHEELPPWPDDPVDIEFDQIARQVGLPAYVLRKAQEEGALSDPLMSGDLDALRCVRRLYGKSWFLRAQLAKSNKAERQSLIRRPELLPWERWAYQQFLTRKIEVAGGSAAPGQRLYLSTLLKTIEMVFRVPASEMTKSRLLQIRKMASNDHYDSKKQGGDLGEIAKKRGVALEPE